MQFLDTTLPSPEENLALDEALLLEAEAGRGSEVLRVWEWPAAAVILGAGCRLAEDVEEEACAADGVPILRRASGGGTVLLGSGCLCYSVVLRYGRCHALREIGSSYEYILMQMRAALAGLVTGIERAGTSDLAIQGRKFSGNSQQRKRHHLLHHGTLLYAFEIAAVERYLRVPARRPDYRRGREHTAFLRNVALDRPRLIEILRDAWEATEGISHGPADVVRRLVQEKYARREWIRRR